MKTILIALTVLLFTACAAEPEVGRSESNLEFPGWDAGIVVDLDAGYDVTEIDPEDEEEVRKLWSEHTGCDVTPGEFLAAPDGTFAAVDIEGESPDGLSYRIARGCGKKYYEPVIGMPGVQQCILCCTWIMTCHPLHGCEIAFTCAKPDCWAYIGPPPSAP